jgi:hypothetical protein
LTETPALARDPGLVNPAAGRKLTTVAPSPAPPPAAPAAADPTSFTAALQADKIVLKWQPVAGVSWYLVGGPGMGSNGHQVQTTSDTVRGLGPGQYEWTVASLTNDRKPLTNWINWPKARITLTPPPPAPVTSGRYRITLAGFKVHHETYDDVLERDGKRDEVYAAAFVQHFDRTTGRFLGGDLFRTKTYGDANNHPDRIPQGHASDLGGLMTGDAVPYGWDEQSVVPTPNPGWFPLVLWDDVLSDGRDVVIVRPTLWEEDGDRTGFEHWRQTLVQDAGSTWGYPPIASDLNQTAISQLRGGGMLSMHASVLDPILFNQDPQNVDPGRDRPIGLQYTNSVNIFRDLLVALTREKIEAELSRQGVPTRGLIPIVFKESSCCSQLALDGDYTLYLRLERAP